MAAKFETEVTSIGRGWSLVENRGSAPYKYSAGSVITPHGIVDVYSQDDMSTISFAWKGKLHRRLWRRSFVHKSLTRLAKAFAKEIAESK